jgi:hypothetical protein
MSLDTDTSAAAADPARDRLAEHLDAERRAGRTVLTLVELSRATSLDPRTVERVMERLAADPRSGVRRSPAARLRWYLNPPDPPGDDTTSG